MKHSLPVFLLLLLLLAGCSREDRAFVAMLDRADSLIQTHPDSALALLDTAGSQEAKESGSQGGKRSSLSMRYRLLRVKAEDKLYKPITGYESLVIDTLVPYFRKHGTPYLNATALFYAGRICADKGDAPQAIDYFQQALDALPEKENPRLRGLVHIQIGWLFIYQDLLPSAIEQFEKAFQYEKIIKDSVYMAHCLQSIGNCYNKEGEKDSALICFHKAWILTSQTDNRRSKGEVLNELAHTSFLAKDYKKTHHYLSLLFDNQDKTTLYNAYTTALMLYYEEGCEDSVFFYCKKVIESGDIYNKYTAYKALASTYLRRGEPKKALQCQNNWEICDDSIKRLKSRETIVRMHSLYNYQLRERQTEKERHEKVKSQYISLTSILLLILSVVTFIALYFIFKRRDMIRQRRIAMLEEINERIRQSHATEDRSYRYVNKSSKMVTASSVSTSLDNMLESKKTQLYLLEAQKNQELILQIKKSDIYSKLCELSRNKIIAKSRDLNELANLMELLFPNFKQSLLILGNISDTKYHICLLELLDFKNVQIADLLCKEPSSIGSARKRLYEELASKKGSAKDLKPFLHNLLSL